MPDITVQEKNLMLIYCTPGDSRRELLATLRQMIAQLTDEDEELCAMTIAVMDKLQHMTDKQFDKLLLNLDPEFL